MNKSHCISRIFKARINHKALIISILVLAFAFGDRLLQSPKSRQNAWQKKLVPQTVFCRATRSKKWLHPLLDKPKMLKSSLKSDAFTLKK